MPQISQALIDMVNTLKAKYDCSTESLDRTPAHNHDVGGAPHSQHVTGEAIDLTFDDETMLLPAARYALELGFGVIELDYTNLHLHLDIRQVPWHVVKLAKETISLEQYVLTHLTSSTA
jgi:uncharacterized protein YcbK (DUF882 family)